MYVDMYNVSKGKDKVRRGDGFSLPKRKILKQIQSAAGPAYSSLPTQKGLAIFFLTYS